MKRRIIPKNGGSLDDSVPVGQEFWEQSGTSPPSAPIGSNASSRTPRVGS